MISKEDVQNLAQLARLQLTDAEIAGLQADISNILEYVGQVAAVSGGDSKEAPLLRNVMRPDAPREAGDIVAGKEEAVRAAFPKREGNFNVVRKIIEKGE